MIIDSHCHLNYEPMSLSLKETIERANNDGVKYLLTISTGWLLSPIFMIVLWIPQFILMIFHLMMGVMCPTIT